VNTHPNDCSGCPHCNHDLRLIMDDFVKGRHESQARRLTKLTRAELPHRFNGTNVPSPTLDQFVEQLRVRTVPHTLDELLTRGQHPVTEHAASDVPSGYTPSPGITITPKEK
jgi:hypothetical protein